MRTRAAVLTSIPGELATATLQLDEPRQNEVTVRLVASGLCHSDDHHATGDDPGTGRIWCGGHEGAGVIEIVGPNTAGFEVGDHVVFSFLPACGRCGPCARGQQHLCDLGRFIGRGGRFEDPPSYRLWLDGEPVEQMACLGTFSERTTVSVHSVCKVPKELPLRSLCLLACCVSTGWGAAVNAAEVRPGHTVIVMGMGGIGTAAVQGAAHAGADHIIVADPSSFKQDMSATFGATDSVATIDEATELARSYTNGQGADSTVVSVGVLTANHVAEAVDSIRKGGTVALVAVGSNKALYVPLKATPFNMLQKTIKGVIFGNWSPLQSIPTLTAMYARGRLQLDEMITRSYHLDEVAQGFSDLRAGRNIRGIVEFD
jgi:NDMA-dependent alcohol dehydrogenase